MQLQQNDIRILDDEQAQFIIAAVKNIEYRFDAESEIILFGSRARGDWHEESDWDFLILSNLPEKSDAKENIRKAIFKEIEIEFSHSVSILFHNKKVWANDYNVTPLYYNILEEGVLV